MPRRTVWTLGPNELALADEIANAIRGLANDDPDRPMTLRALAHALGIQVSAEPIANRGDLAYLEGVWVISLAEDLPHAEESIVMGHELDHWWFQHRGEPEPPYKEELADAVGARLAAPESVFRPAVQFFDHSYKPLATRFHLSERATVLRICEVTGRPGMISRKSGGYIARGGDFEWADDWRAVPRSKAHYVKVDDWWGMLAERDWWAGAA